MSCFPLICLNSNEIVTVDEVTRPNNHKSNKPRKDIEKANQKQNFIKTNIKEVPNIVMQSDIGNNHIKNINSINEIKNYYSEYSEETFPSKKVETKNQVNFKQNPKSNNSKGLQSKESSKSKSIQLSKRYSNNSQESINEGNSEDIIDLDNMNAELESYNNEMSIKNDKIQLTKKNISKVKHLNKSIGKDLSNISHNFKEIKPIKKEEVNKIKDVTPKKINYEEKNLKNANKNIREKAITTNKNNEKFKVKNINKDSISSTKDINSKKEENETTTKINECSEVNSSINNYKDPFSCLMCESIYRNSIINSNPIKSSFKCFYCNNYLNENSLRFYEMKYFNAQSSTGLNSTSYLNFSNMNTISNYIQEHNYAYKNFHTNQSNFEYDINDYNNICSANNIAFKHVYPNNVCSFQNENIYPKNNSFDLREVNKIQNKELSAKHLLNNLNTNNNKLINLNKIIDSNAFNSNYNLNNSYFINKNDQTNKINKALNISSERAISLKFDQIQNHKININNQTFTTESHNFSITNNDNINILKERAFEKLNGANKLTGINKVSNKESKSIQNKNIKKRNLNSLDINNVSYEANKLTQIDSHIDKNIDSDPSLLDFESDMIIDNIVYNKKIEKKNEFDENEDEFNLVYKKDNNSRKCKENKNGNLTKNNCKEWQQEIEVKSGNYTPQKNIEKSKTQDCLLVFDNDNYKSERINSFSKKINVSKKKINKSIDKLSKICDYSKDDDNEDIIENNNDYKNNKNNIKVETPINEENFVISKNNSSQVTNLAELFKNRKKTLINKIETREYNQDELKEKYKIKLNATKSVDNFENRIKPTSSHSEQKKKDPPYKLIERLRKGEKVVVRIK